MRHVILTSVMVPIMCESLTDATSSGAKRAERGSVIGTCGDGGAKDGSASHQGLADFLNHDESRPVVHVWLVGGAIEIYDLDPREQVRVGRQRERHGLGPRDDLALDRELDERRVEPRHLRLGFQPPQPDEAELEEEEVVRR